MPFTFISFYSFYSILYIPKCLDLFCVFVLKKINQESLKSHSIPYKEISMIVNIQVDVENTYSDTVINKTNTYANVPGS